MNLFIPYPDDLPKSARVVDDKRLNKQVLEAYQVGSAVLKKLRNPNEKIAWINHPACRFISNGGNPKFPWLKQYIKDFDAEWQRRGFVRGKEFLDKIDLLFQEAEEFSFNFSFDPVIAYVGGGLEVVEFGGTVEQVGKLYRELLRAKWDADIKAGKLPKWTNCDGFIGDI